MWAVCITLVFLIAVCMIKKIPLIGGNLSAAFFGAGIIALLLMGKTDISLWLSSWLKGFNSIAFIFFIIFFGTIFSAIQIETGAMEVILNILRAAFGSTAQGLVLAILIALYIGGSLMGTVAAVGAVVGILVVPSLLEIGIHPDLICAIIVTGASMGGMMPPVSNAIILAGGLMNQDPNPLLLTSYITVGIGLVVIAFFFCKVYIGNKYHLPEELIPKDSAFSIFTKNWTKLIPLFVLLLCVLLASIPSLRFDFPKWLLSQLPGWNGNLFKSIAAIPVFGKITNNIVMSMVFAILASFLTYPHLWSALDGKLAGKMRRIAEPELILVATAFFLGAFKASGMAKLIALWAGSLPPMLLLICGAAALVIAGMLTGGQSTSQMMLLPVLAPAWSAIGLSDYNIALASAHFAMAGQGLPPCDMNTFIIAGLVSAILGKAVNPMKSMFYSSPYCIYLILAGAWFLL